MKKLIPILLLFAACSASGAGIERISLLVTVTNTPVTGNTLVINAASRFWTNANSATTILTNLLGTNYSTTNLYNQIAANPYAGPLILQYASSNQIRLIAPIGGALAGSAAGGWASITLSTQSGPATYTALYPMENMVGETNRTNQGSSLVYGLGIYSTNAFPTNATATSNFITKGASPDQHISSPLRVTGTLRSTSQSFLTNGVTSRMTNINSVSSNHVNYGNAIRSEGAGGNSFQAGSNALAVGDLSVALGNGALASNTTTVAIGTDAKATNQYAMAIGNGAIASGDSSMAVGKGATAESISSLAVGGAASAFTFGDAVFGSGAEGQGGNSVVVGSTATTGATNAVAIGARSSGGHTNSVALGADSATTIQNQIRLGTATHFVSVPGVLAIDGTQTNTVFSGTNKFDLAISYTATNVTTLANGANDVDPGFKTYVRVSGPSAAYSIDKIDRGYNGRILVIQKTDSLTLTIPNNSGAGVLGDAAKILTGTGGTLTITNNPGFVQLIYDATASRWGVINKSN